MEIIKRSYEKDLSENILLEISVFHDDSYTLSIKVTSEDNEIEQAVVIIENLDCIKLFRDTVDRLLALGVDGIIGIGDSYLMSERNEIYEALGEGTDVGALSININKDIASIVMEEFTGGEVKSSIDISDNLVVDEFIHALTFVIEGEELLSDE